MKHEICTNSGSLLLHTFHILCAECRFSCAKITSLPRTLTVSVLLGLLGLTRTVTLVRPKDLTKRSQCLAKKAKRMLCNGHAKSDKIVEAHM